jgi:endonuclease/exonuclease/phosphatase family metal-dependent hydrolase
VTSADAGSGTRADVVRILSWNIRHIVGDPLAVHRILRAANPDLVCLQEAPRWAWSRWQLASLARAAGLRFVAGGRSAAANALLCSDRIEVTDVQAFRYPLDRWPGWRRGAVLATAALPGCPAFRLAGVHLSLDPQERSRHVADLLARLTASGLPIVIAGDLNEPPGGPSWQAFSAIVSDPAPAASVTFPAINPRRRIDAVLTSGQIETVEYASWQPDPRDARLASDHLPVLSLIRLRLS